MLIRKSADVQPSEITSKEQYASRRRFMRRAGAVALVAGLPGLIDSTARAQGGTRLPRARKSPYSTAEPMNSLKEITSYNNFYEFGTEKDDPARYAGRLRVRPWTVTVSGEVKRPRTLDIDELVKLAPLEERIYGLRCVEA